MNRTHLDPAIRSTAIRAAALALVMALATPLTSGCEGIRNDPNQGRLTDGGDGGTPGTDGPPSGQPDGTGADSMVVADGPGSADGPVADRVPPSPDLGQPDGASPDTHPPDGSVTPPPDPPAFLDISVTTIDTVQVVESGSAFTPEVVTIHDISVMASSDRGSFTSQPTGTVGGCDLYPPVGTSSWPPGTLVEPTPSPLPAEYVTITVGGAAQQVTATSDGLVTARGQFDQGAQVVVTVTYPGHAAFQRQFTVDPGITLTAPSTSPSINQVLEGSYTRGDDLTVTWTVDHPADATQLVDIFGQNGAARCEVTHGTGSLTQSGSNVQTYLLGAEPSLSLALFASRMDEATEQATRVRQIRSWGAPSILLDVSN
jgi:hypothetical protein